MRAPRELAEYVAGRVEHIRAFRFAIVAHAMMLAALDVSAYALLDPALDAPLDMAAVAMPVSPIVHIIASDFGDAADGQGGQRTGQNEACEFAQHEVPPRVPLPLRNGGRGGFIQRECSSCRSQPSGSKRTAPGAAGALKRKVSRRPVTWTR